MRICYVVFFVLLFSYSCREKITSQESPDYEASVSEKPIPAENRGTYRQITAVWGKDSITMHLYLFGKKCSGSYYNNSWDKPKKFTGVYSSENIISLDLYEDSVWEKLNLQWNSNEYLGELVGHKPAQKITILFKPLSKSLDAIYIGVKDSLVVVGHEIARYEVSSFVPLGKNNNAAMLYDSIKSVLKMDNPLEGSLLSVIHQTKDLYFKTSRETLGADSLTTESATAFSSSLQMNVKLFHEFKNFTVLSVEQYTYTGGAHGYEYTKYLNFDLSKNKQIFLSDLILMEKERAVLRILENKFRKIHHLSTSQSLSDGGLFDNHIPTLTNNFYITSHGINFIYAPYEIAPYAIGAIEIFVPFKELEGVMKASVEE